MEQDKFEEWAGRALIYVFFAAVAMLMAAVAYTPSWAPEVSMSKSDFVREWIKKNRSSLHPMKANLPYADKDDLRLDIAFAVREVPEINVGTPLSKQKLEYILAAQEQCRKVYRSEGAVPPEVCMQKLESLF